MREFQIVSILVYSTRLLLHTTFNITQFLLVSVFYFQLLRYKIQGVSGGIVNSLGGGSMDYSE
jgi:hypothetical protein